MKINKHILYIAGILLSIVVLLSILNFTVAKPNEIPNGFERKKLGTLEKTAEIKMDVSIVDIAGIHEGKVYLGTNEPGKLIITDMDLSNPQAIDLGITIDSRLPSTFFTTIRENILYIFGSNVPEVIKYDLLTKEETHYPIDRAFSRAAIISDQTIIMRGFDTTFDDLILRKANLTVNSYQEENDITDRFADGGFASDGMVHYDKRTNTVVYTHFYSNRINYLDTTLNLICRGKTIDTFHSYQAMGKNRTSSIGTGSSFSKPPKLLNIFSITFNGRLYIASLLKADNDMDDPNTYMKMDVYSIYERNYEGSFYIPYEEPGISKFMVTTNHIYVLYNKKVSQYNYSLNNETFTRNETENL